MAEPFEIARLTASRRAAEEARRSTLVRGEHVWVRIDYTSGTRWMPGILAGWHQASDGGWHGHVAVVMVIWKPRERVWSSSIWEERAPADRIVAAGTVAPDEYDQWDQW